MRRHPLLKRYLHRRNRSGDPSLVQRTPDADLYWLRQQYTNWMKHNVNGSNSTNGTIGRHRIVIHSIRDPVDTILSGYNYHKLVSREDRTRKPHWPAFEYLDQYVQNAESPRDLGGPKYNVAAEWCYNKVLVNNGSRKNLFFLHLYSVYVVLDDRCSSKTDRDSNYLIVFCLVFP